MDSVFFKSALVQPPRILGRQLRPFSCYHALVLTLLDSPFIAGKYADGADLIQAVMVCSEGYGDCLAEFQHFTRSRLCRIRWAIRLFLRGQDRNMLRAWEYFKAFGDGPEYWLPKDSKYSRIPYPFKLVGTIATHMNGITLNEIWNMPMCLAKCFEACIAEEAGMNLADQDIADAEAAFKEADNGDDKSKSNPGQ